MRAAAVAVAVAVAVVILGAHAGCNTFDPDTGAEACSVGEQTSCFCPAGAVCDLSCHGNNYCVMTCEDDARCDISCDGADESCLVRCAEYSPCEIDAANVGAAIACDLTSPCTVERCLVDRCTVDCQGAVQTRDGDVVTCGIP